MIRFADENLNNDLLRALRRSVPDVNIVAPGKRVAEADWILTFWQGHRRKLAFS
jgi:hypothetical protein